MHMTPARELPVARYRVGYHSVMEMLTTVTAAEIIPRANIEYKKMGIVAPLAVLIRIHAKPPRTKGKNVVPKRPPQMPILVLSIAGHTTNPPTISLAASQS